MKALEKDRSRRYGSPAELGADIGHYLRAEPVLAHPPSAGYSRQQICSASPFRRLLGPEHPDTANIIYNLGCLAALQGRRDEAFSLLRQAVDHGYPPWADLVIDKDSDLQSLHGDPRFAALVADAKERAAAAQKPR